MTSLIKSTHVIDDPIVLGHAKMLDEISSPIEQSPAKSEFIAEPSSADVVAESMFEEPTVIAPEPVVEEETVFTYEDYKQRFDTELRALEEEAKQRGTKLGEAAGLEKAKKEYADQVDALAEVMKSLRTSLDQKIDGLSEMTVEIVCEAVAKVIGESMVDKDVVAAAVRQVVRKAKEQTKMIVRVSQADWTFLHGHEAELTDGFSAGSVEILPDDRVQMGGCLVETSAGTLDGRLEVQLERLREALLNARSSMQETEAAA